MHMHEHIRKLDDQLEEIVMELSATIKEEFDKRRDAVPSGRLAVESSVLIEVSEIGFLLNTIRSHLAVLDTMLRTNYARDVSGPVIIGHEETLQERCNELWARLNERVSQLDNPAVLMNLSASAYGLLKAFTKK